MRTLVFGGANCGKSHYAEQLAMDCGGRRAYVATMRPLGEEAEARITRHRAMRADKGFVTIERYRALGGLDLQGCDTVLVECLGNALANELFDPGTKAEGAKAALLEDLASLERRAKHLILVSNDVFSDGISYPPETEAYIRILGEIHRYLTAKWEGCVELVCGIPLWHKGGAPC